MSSPPPANTPHSDAQIVRAVLAGNANDFALLVDRYHARCLRVATHLLGDSDAAEDAVQDAFVRAYRHLAGYHERDRFGAWLLRIVVNQCRTLATKEARFIRFGDEPQFQTATQQGPHATAHGPDSIHDQRAELAHALAQLPADQREALVLRFSDELSYDEIASLTGVGVSALKMRVKRGCARLRTLLSGYLHV